MALFRLIGLGSYLILNAVLGTNAIPTDLDGRQNSDCAAVTCPTEHKCKVINGAATCVPITSPVGVVCGPTTCDKGLQCCNPSCGICTKPGEGCTEQACLGPRCGPYICPYGEVCCNESCGKCAKPGQPCTMEGCLGPRCGNKNCAFGEECCNDSCGICARPGQGCIQLACRTTLEGIPCGSTTCLARERCCEKRGYCAQPFEICIE